MRQGIDWRKSESKNVCRATFLSYYMRSPSKIREAPIAITPGDGPQNELDFLLTNHQGKIYVFEKDRDTFHRLQDKYPPLENPKAVLCYGDMFQFVSFSAEKTWGAAWADTTGFVNQEKAKRVRRIIKNLMPGGVFALTTCRDNYRGIVNVKYDKTPFQPASKVEINYGWDSPMTFFCGRKR